MVNLQQLYAHLYRSFANLSIINHSILCSLVENILKAETGKEIPTFFRITASGVFLPQLKGTLSYRISQHKAYFKIVFFFYMKNTSTEKR